LPKSKKGIVLLNVEKTDLWSQGNPFRKIKEVRDSKGDLKRGATGGGVYKKPVEISKSEKAA